MSSRREWEPVYEKHPKLSALSRITNARKSARPSWRGGRHFHKAECLPLLRSSIKLNLSTVTGTVSLDNKIEKVGDFAKFDAG